MTEPTPIPCQECKKRPAVYHRKLCWTCINSHRRYGLTKAELDKQRVREGKNCCICGKRAYFKFRTRCVCLDCRTTLITLSDPKKREQIVKQFS
jgi:hypothetical protein